mmetsp:Transcript_86955/g.173961  ORF Transcript_86955/g.173961 Transcript_86955/m.173961 type:complete len:262 (+) Transcript_86955:871-1656(+)
MPRRASARCRRGLRAATSSRWWASRTSRKTHPHRAAARPPAHPLQQRFGFGSFLEVKVGPLLVGSALAAKRGRCLWALVVAAALRVHTSAKPFRGSEGRGWWPSPATRPSPRLLLRLLLLLPSLLLCRLRKCSWCRSCRPTVSTLEVLSQLLPPKRRPRHRSRQKEASSPACPRPLLLFSLLRRCRRCQRDLKECPRCAFFSRRPPREGRGGARRGPENERCLRSTAPLAVRSRLALRRQSRNARGGRARLLAEPLHCRIC